MVICVLPARETCPKVSGLRRGSLGRAWPRCKLTWVGNSGLPSRPRGSRELSAEMPTGSPGALRGPWATEHPSGLGTPPRTLLQPPLPPPPQRSAGFLSSSPSLGMWKDPDLSIPSLPNKPLQSKVHSPVLCGERKHTAYEGWHSHHLVHLWRAPRGAAVRVKEEPAKCKASRLIC